MNTLARRNIRFRIYDWFNHRWVYHSIFWFFFLLLLTIIETYNQKHTFLYSLSNEIINVFFYALVVYFNLKYLIPNYLTKNKFLTYGGLLILSAVVITPLKVIVFFFKYGNSPEAQNGLIENLNWYFIFTFIIASASTLVSIVKDWVQQVTEKQALQTQTMQSELRFLKSQINPHFLFNTLNNLYALTLKKSDKAPEIVIKLSEMMRYMLYECNEKRVLLSKEVNYIHNYLDLEKLRQGKNVDISFESEGEISEQTIAPLMFIPFLENSFKHGLSNQISKGFVNIRLSAERNKVYFFIENSKAEKLPQKDKNRPSGGIGLVNVHRRLNLLYPDSYELNIDDTPTTYAVNLYIELD